MKVLTAMSTLPLARAKHRLAIASFACVTSQNCITAAFKSSGTDILRLAVPTMTLKHLLVDIEGTTTSISFVHDVLFPFAREHLRAHVTEHFVELCESGLLSALSEVDNQCSVDSVDDVCACVLRLMDADRKVAPLKSLQGQIWTQGYQSGELIGHIYDDVVPALQRIALPTSVFSSGSVAAQKLLFAHTAHGNLLHMFQQHHDTTTAGSKVEAASYVRIAAALGVEPREILFVTDNIAEAIAAREADVRSVLSVRPGTAQLPSNAADLFPIVHSFAELATD